jgi:hypothetical protein
LLIFYGLIGFGYLILDLRSFHTSGASPGFFKLAWPILYLLSAALFAVSHFRNFVRLSTDSIELSRMRGRKILPLGRIKGRRRYTEKADPYGPPAKHLVLEPNDDQFPKLDLKDGSWFDESFYAWFDSLPDLDAMDGAEAPKSKYANFSLN